MKWNIKDQNHFTVMWFPPLDLTKTLNYSCKIVHTTLMYNVQCSSYILPWCDFCSGKVFSPQERDTIFNIYEYWGSTSISTLLSVQYLLLHFTMVSASLNPGIRWSNWKYVTEKSQRLLFSIHRLFAILCHYCRAGHHWSQGAQVTDF